jgi:hypothetical protein
LQERGITRFDRDRIARRVIRDLAQRPAAEIPEVTLAAFSRVIHAVNTLVQRWKGQDECVDPPLLVMP